MKKQRLYHILSTWLKRLSSYNGYTEIKPLVNRQKTGSVYINSLWNVGNNVISCKSKMWGKILNHLSRHEGITNRQTDTENSPLLRECHLIPCSICQSFYSSPKTYFLMSLVSKLRFNNKQTGKSDAFVPGLSCPAFVPVSRSLEPGFPRHRAP